LVHHQYLETINMVIDPCLHALCCSICMVALAPHQAPYHISTKHAALKLDINKFKQVIKNLAIPEDLPLSPVDIATPFKGLKLLKGWACEHCPRVYANMKSMSSHHLHDHSDLPHPSTWPECDMQ
ncbi:hypothetical protein PAXRUDRAFT_82732, partial [Paxillus rubicundulus Ve08.2h10]